MISQKSIEELKNRIDILDIISHYVSVKKAGRNYVCVCPFHDDKNPSMSINVNDGYYHCFACKAGGDAITFVMEYEKLSYPEAIEKIAQMTNFSLEYSNEKSHFKVDKKILEIVNAYYQSELYKNEEAVKYLYNRGFNDNLIQYFGLGWAGASQNLLRLLENENITTEEALNVGIIKENESGVFASFINRITFPINNHTGKLVGFGGRTISNHPAKYVNSPQSSVFDKSSIFYAYDLAKKFANEKKEIIITEGYMDTIMLHRAGLNNAVAVLGTALTTEHLPLLRRLECKVILSFDGDSAGVNAAFKSAKLLTISEIDCNVVIIPGDLDPADMVVSGRIEELKNLYESGVEGGEWVIKKIASEFDLTRPINRQKALEEIAKYTRALSVVVAQGYINEIENLLKSKINANFIINQNFTQSSQNYTQSFVQNTTQNLARPSKNDYLELSIIKTALKKVDFLYLIKDIVENESFFYHRDLYEALVSGKSDVNLNANLRELLLNDTISIYDSENLLKSALISLQERYLNHQKEMIKNSSNADKIELLVKIEKELRKLKGMK